MSGVETSVLMAVALGMATACADSRRPDFSADPGAVLLLHLPRVGRTVSRGQKRSDETCRLG